MASNPQWPESPEMRRARIRADATARRDEANFEPEVVNDLPRATTGASQPLNDRQPPPMNAAGNQREDFNKRLAANQQGSSTNRTFLSEPPLDYRAPAATAAAGDVGEDEWRKERRAKAEARKKSGGRSWKDVVPWL